MVTVIIKKIEDLNESNIEKVLNNLSEAGKIRLNKKNNPALRRASLCALSLLEPHQLADLAYTDEGSPYFRTLDNCISISHSNTCAAIAVSLSNTESVGVDIEDTAAQAASPTNKKRFLTENEQSLLDQGTPYLNIWTKKEALFKYLKTNNLSLINLDSTAPEEFGAKFITLPVGDNILTACVNMGELINIIEK